jgi:tetratricopeptide (TPR) repeat protein
MTLTADLCPRCGATVTSKSVGGLCVYCGARLRLAKAAQALLGVEPESDDAKIANLIELGNIASEAGRVDEALGYFNRVLEARPDLSLAWLYKALLIARTVRLEEPVLRAVISCFEKAVIHAPDADRENITLLCTGQALVFASGLWEGLKALATRGPVNPALAGRLVGEIGDALAFIVRHNGDDEEQLRPVLTFLRLIAFHEVRNQLQPDTVEALAQLYKSASDHLLARVPGEQIPPFPGRGARQAGSFRQIGIVILIAVIIATYMFVWRSWSG